MTLNPILGYILKRDIGLERTNPVHVVLTLLEQLTPLFVAAPERTVQRFSQLLELLGRDGLRLPHFYLDKLRRDGCLEGDPPAGPAPRVVGLMADLKSGDGFVLPLWLERSDLPQLDERLPFTHDDLHGVFAGLVRSLGLQRALPERLRFRGDNPAGIPAQGDSMHVAALLAALDALTAHERPRLRGACAVVEPRPDGGFVEVGHIAAKLNAFCREYGHGALLICLPGSKAVAPFREAFDEVWEADGYAGLAKHLDDENLLEPLLQQGEVSAREWQALRDRLDSLNHQQYGHLDAVDLGRRLLACSLPAGLPLALRDGVVQQLAAAHRHLGEYTEAERRGRELYEAVRARGEGGSDDEEADAAVEYVASFYDGHRFQKIVDELTPWRERILADRRRFRFLTRVKVFNALGRAQVIRGLPGWEENFRESLALQRSLDPVHVAWTASDLVHGLLRQRRVEEALRELEALGPLDAVENLWSRGALKAYRAEAARQQGKSWTDPRMEHWAEASPPPDHVFALYHQAVARQSKCPDASRRLHQAAIRCRVEVGPNQDNISLLLAHCFDLAAAAVEANHFAWDAARQEICDYLQRDAAIAAHYERPVGALPQMPDWPSAEALLDAIPYL